MTNTESIKNPGLRRPGFFISMQFFFGVPEAFLPVDDPVVCHFHTFAFEPFLHGGWRLEKLARTQLAGLVDHPLGGTIFLVVAAAHGPAHLPGTALVAEVSSNSPV